MATTSSLVLFNTEACHLCEQALSLLQPFLQQGVQQGMQQGVQQGVQQVAQRLRTLGVSEDIIAEAIQLNTDKLKAKK